MIFSPNNRNRIVIGFMGFAIVSVVALLIFQGVDSSRSRGIRILSDNVDLQAKDVVYSDVGDSGLKWEIIADNAKYMKNENVAVFDNVKVKVIVPNGRTFSMTGKNGRLNTQTKDMELTGNVDILSDRGDRMNTDVLKYKGSDQRIYTDSPVTMENKRMQILGKGMSLSLKNQNISLLSKVRARINKNDR